jgi:hypothetical protein
MIVNKRLRHNNTKSADFLLNCKDIIVYEANHMRELTREIRLVETIVRNYFLFTSINYLKVY